MNISKVINQLIETDEYFNSFWDNQGDKERKEILEFIHNIDSAYRLKNKNEINIENNAKIKKLFFRIPDIEFNYKYFPKEIERFLYDEKLQSELLIKSGYIIREFLIKRNLTNEYYGKIKEIEKIKEKLKKTNGYEHNHVNHPLLCSWDIVRYRVVCDSLQKLFDVTSNFLEDNLEIVLRCRNYFMYPKFNDNTSSYWAIHIVIKVEGFIVEIQFLTKLRAILSYLDHFILYKKNELNFSAKIEDWMNLFVTKSNLFQIENLEKECIPTKIVYK